MSARQCNVFTKAPGAPLAAQWGQPDSWLSACIHPTDLRLRKDMAEPCRIWSPTALNVHTYMHMQACTHISVCVPSLADVSHLSLSPGDFEWVSLSVLGEETGWDQCPIRGLFHAVISGRGLFSLETT